MGTKERNIKEANENPEDFFFKGSETERKETSIIR